jgi:predicted nicotinamide N-methyase
MQRCGAKVNGGKTNQMLSGAQKPSPEEDIRPFIREHLTLACAPTLPQILIHQATPKSGLGRISEEGSPYWAYAWPGGLALAHHLIANPNLASGRSVLDIGTGSGLVAIVAAKAGAREVTAVDIDPRAVIATELNAKANAVRLSILCADILDDETMNVDLVTVGDLFYDQTTAERTLSCLRRYQANGIEILIGDPGRAFLPVSRLRQIASYPVPDFGEPAAAAKRESGVYTLR